MKFKIFILLFLLNTIVSGQEINEEGNIKDFGEKKLSLNAILFWGGKLRKSINPLSEVITTLHKNDYVELIDFQEGYWKILKGEYSGYISESILKSTYEVKSFKIKLEKRKEETRRLEEELEKGIKRDKDGLILPNLLKRRDEN